VNITIIGRACATVVITIAGINLATTPASADDPAPSCDPAVVQAALTKMQDAAKVMPTLFPDNAKTGGDTAAQPKIWEAKADFNSKWEKLGKEAAEIAGKINAWANANHVALEINHDQGNWMARDPKGAWLSTLLNIYGDTTGLDAKPVPTAGSTTAKLMPNAINFGPAMPRKKYTAHNANEYKEVPDLDLDMQMFTEMLVRIGNLPSMQ